MSRQPDTSGGEWITPTILQQPDGSLWYTIEYLADRTGWEWVDHRWRRKGGSQHRDYPHPNEWYSWIRQPCPYLDPNVNGGSIHSEIHPVAADKRLHRGQKRTLRLWSKADVDQVLKRADDREARRTLPGEQGEWITENVLQTREGRIYLTDPGFVESYQCDATLPSRLRSRGRIHWFRALRQTGGRGAREKVIVSSKADFDRCREAASKRREKLGQVSVPAGWKPLMDLLAALGGRACNKGSLGTVLRQFRQDRPEAAVAVPRVNDKMPHKVVTETWHYDPEVFFRWLDGRDFRRLAAEILKTNPSPRTLMVARRKTEKALRFLRRLLPRPGCKMEANEVWAKARKEGFTVRTMKQAALDLPVQYHREGSGRNGTLKVYWVRGRRPVEVAATPTVTTQAKQRSPAGRQECSGNGRKRPAKERHEKWKRWRTERKMSYGEIADQEFQETGRRLTREAVIAALKRLGGC
jgi:hypothetical protein